jgi:hypothetical protein
MQTSLHFLLLLFGLFGITGTIGLAAGGTAEIHEPFSRRRRRTPTSCTIVPIEIQQRWSPSKRYSDGINRSTNDDMVTGAQWVFSSMLSHAGGPQKCTLRSLALLTGDPPPSHMTWQNVCCYITNHYLEWEIFRSAALEGNFASVLVGYNRNT